MKKRTLILLATLEASLFLVAVYFEPTYRARGTLWGEAFFEGRPTSYWRMQCDAWLQRFDTPDDATPWAQGYVGFAVKVPGGNDRFVASVPMLGGSFETKGPRPPTSWNRVYNYIRQKKDDPFAPQVLWGLPGSEPVLQELVEEEKYRRFAVNALERIKIYLDLRRSIGEEGFEIIHEVYGS